MCAHAPGGDWCDRAARGNNGYTTCHPPFWGAHACSCADVIGAALSRWPTTFSRLPLRAESKFSA